MMEQCLDMMHNDAAVPAAAVPDAAVPASVLVQ